MTVYFIFILTYREAEANISVSVLVGAAPQCSSCRGQREPRANTTAAEDSNTKQTNNIQQQQQLLLLLIKLIISTIIDTYGFHYHFDNLRFKQVAKPQRFFSCTCSYFFRFK